VSDAVQDAFEELRTSGASPLVLVCEHASNAVPEDYGSLGLTQAELDRHIGYDLGAAALTRALAARLDATALLGVVSRLLIDINRQPWHEGFVPVESDGTHVPGNADADDAERARREARWFTPFHARVGAEIDARIAAGRSPVLVTIHSFTPMLAVAGAARPWPVGVLYERERRFGQAVLQELRERAPGPIGDNEPYDFDLEGGDVTVLVHGDDREVPCIAFEVRHDELADDAAVAAWCEHLAIALERALERSGLARSQAAPA
jgi:predicted N-formylglutamate amidohydrolase